MLWKFGSDLRNIVLRGCNGGWLDVEQLLVRAIRRREFSLPRAWRPRISRNDRT